MSRSRSKPRAAVLPPAAVAASRERRVFALAEIDIAPENLRHGEPADDDIPLLAETLRAAGQLQPLTVRPGAGEDERPAMALDGRRRLLALRQLLAAGRIGEDFPVEVVVETDPARQAAAAVLTNTAAPVHVADVIAAIGRMLKTSLKAPEIAAVQIMEAEKVRLRDEVVSLPRAQQIVSGAPYAVQPGRYWRAADGRTISEHYKATYPLDDEAEI